MNLYVFSMDTYCDPSSKIQHVLLFCKDREHKNVVIRKELKPYFYFAVKSRRTGKFINHQKPEQYRQILDKMIKDFKKSGCNINDYEMTIVKDKKNFFGYSTETFTACKITSQNRRSLYSAKGLLTSQMERDTGNSVQDDIQILTFESAVDPVVQFIHDNQVKSCSWFTIQEGDYRIIETPRDCKEFVVDYVLEIKDMSLCKQNEELNATVMPRLIIAAFDIETTSYDGKFPSHENAMDQIVQISVTIGWDGKIKKRLLFGLNGGWENCYDRDSEDFAGLCDEDVELRTYESADEYQLLLKFFMVLMEENPDVLTGYNIFNFDEKYIFGRCEYLSRSYGCEVLSELSHRLGKFIKFKQVLAEKVMNSSAAGNNMYYYLDSKGLLHVDAMVMIDKDFKPEIKTLDYVSSLFIQQKIKSIGTVEDQSEDQSENQSEDDSQVTLIIDVQKDKHDTLKLLEDGSYIQLMDQYNFTVIPKAKITKVYHELQKIELRCERDSDLFKKHTQAKKWTLTKDDMEYALIFRTFNTDCSTEEQAKLRRVIGRYCIKDSDLVFYLTVRLGIVDNLLAEAKVCNVPINFLTTRGQGAKISSPVIAKTKQQGFLIQDQEKIPGQVMGAFVFDPVQGYYRYPIITLDFNSLYPSTMITYNISPETLLSENAIKTLDLNPEQVVTVNVLKNAKECQQETKYDIHHEGFGDEYGVDLIDADVDVDRQIKFHKDQKGIFPSILDQLLTERKQVRKGMYEGMDPLIYKLLDAKQKSLKVVANSLYGLLGTSTSIFCSYDCASATTAGGRFNITRAKNFVINRVSDFFADEEKFKWLLQKKNPARAVDSKKLEKYCELIRKINNEYTYRPQIIYGDTDSIFINMNFTEKDEELREKHKTMKVEDQQIVGLTIEIGMVISDMINQVMHAKLCLAYEKIFYYFLSFKKKHYFGMLCEDNPKIANLKYSGIVLVRKDYSQICKYIYRNILNCLIASNDGQQMLAEYQRLIRMFMDGEFGIEMQSTTKKVDDDYKKPETIAQRVLADRIEARENKKIATNSRLRFIQIYRHDINNKVHSLQGDKIETIEFYLDQQKKIAPLKQQMWELVDKYINNIKSSTSGEFRNKMFKACYVNLLNNNQDILLSNLPMERLSKKLLEDAIDTKQYVQVGKGEFTKQQLHQRMRQLFLDDIIQQFACIKTAKRDISRKYPSMAGEKLFKAGTETETRDKAVKSVMQRHEELFTQFESKIEEQFANIAGTKQHHVVQDVTSALYFDGDVFSKNAYRHQCKQQNRASNEKERQAFRDNYEQRRQILDLFLEIERLDVKDDKINYVDKQIMIATQKLFSYTLDQKAYQQFTDFHDNQRINVAIKRFQVFDLMILAANSQCEEFAERVITINTVTHGASQTALDRVHQHEIDEPGFIAHVKYLINILAAKPGVQIQYREEYFENKTKEQKEKLPTVSKLNLDEMRVIMIRKYLEDNGCIKVRDYHIIDRLIKKLVLKNLTEAIKHRHDNKDTNSKVTKLVNEQLRSQLAQTMEVDVDESTDDKVISELKRQVRRQAKEHILSVKQDLRS